MNQLFSKLESSFKKASRGEESFNVMIWYWGVLAYIFAFFVADKLVKLISFRFVDITISVLMVAYFSWHAYATKKCAPKKPKLSPEEKAELKKQRRAEMGKKFMRKLLLRESITKWDPLVITIVIDIFCIATFLDYVVR